MYTYTNKQKKADNTMGLSLLALTTIKTLSTKAMPIIKAYACRSCNTLAYVSVKGNRITVEKCACVKGAK